MRLNPKSRRRDAVWDGERLTAWVHPPPVDGEANGALIELLAERLDVPRSSLRIVRGHASRDKIVSCEGLDPARLEALRSQPRLL